MQTTKETEMADLYDNPMGLCGFEFVEFASPMAQVLEPLFERMGFTLVAKHRSKDVVLYRQGDINFIVNREPKSIASYFAAEHGASACGLAFRVRMRTTRTTVRWSWARNPLKFPQVRWSCACLPSKALAVHRCI